MSAAEEQPHELSLDLPAAHSAGRMARQLLRQFALREGLPEAEVERMEFVAGELLDNAVDHGGGGAAMDEEDLTEDVRMSVLARVAGGGWSVEVMDQGGADLEAVRELLAPRDGAPDLEDERGRGFFLIREMVDELAVAKSPDGLGLSFRVRRRYDGAR